MKSMRRFFHFWINWKNIQIGIFVKKNNSYNKKKKMMKNNKPWKLGVIRIQEILLKKKPFYKKMEVMLNICQLIKEKQQ